MIVLRFEEKKRVDVLIYDFCFMMLGYFPICSVFLHHELIIFAICELIGESLGVNKY